MPRKSGPHANQLALGTVLEQIALAQREADEERAWEITMARALHERREARTARLAALRALATAIERRAVA